MLIYRKPRTRQPQGVAQIDWGHPLLRNVRAFVDPFTGTERVTGTPVTPVFGAERMGVGPGGYGFYCGPNSKWKFTPAPATDILANKSVSIFALTSILTTPTLNIAGIVGAHSPSQMGLLTLTSATSLRAFWANNNADAGYSLVGGKVLAAYMRADRNLANTTQGAASDDRGPATLGTPVGAASALSFPTTWEIGGDTRAGNGLVRYIEQVLHFAVIVQDYWSQEDFDSLVRNPYQLYKPQQIYVPVGAGVAAEAHASGGAAAVDVLSAGAGLAAESASSGAAAAVDVAAAGAGAAAETATSGGAAVIEVTATGGGLVVLEGQGGGAATIEVIATGAGTAAESHSSGGAATVEVLATGAGIQVQEGASGGAAVVDVVATGAGLAVESHTSGGAAQIIVTATGGGLEIGAPTSGGAAYVGVLATGGGVAFETHTSGGAAYVGVLARGAGADPTVISWRDVFNADSHITTSLALASPITTRADLRSPLH